MSSWRHSRESGNPDHSWEKTAACLKSRNATWIPAFAGMTQLCQPPECEAMGENRPIVYGGDVGATLGIVLTPISTKRLKAASTLGH